MVLDEPGPLDTTIEAGGITFVMDEELAREALPLTIDNGMYGLTIRSGKMQGSSCD